LHNRRLLTLSLFANFIIVPLIAITLIFLIPMNPQLAAGLLLVSIAAGAPSTAKVAQITRGNVAQAVSLTIIMTIITIVLMPFLIPFILEGAQTDPLYVMGNLVVMILIPIIIGIIIKNRSEPLAARLEVVVDYVSDISIAVIFLTLGIIFLSQLGEVVSTGSGALAVFVAIVFTLASIGITYLIGHFDKDSRRNLALGAGFRNITAVLVVIFASFTNLKKDARVAVFSSFTNIQNDALLMVLMVTVFSIIIVSILVGIIYRKRRKAEKKKLAG
jgi:BASS family bile acid:Na+ symporter